MSSWLLPFLQLNAETKSASQVRITSLPSRHHFPHAARMRVDAY